MTDEAKRVAGVAAAERVHDGMTIGLGTGSTVAYFLDELARRELAVTGVATSTATENRCRELGIALTDPGSVTGLDLAVDGADELDSDLNLTKGGGGALLREKVVADLAGGLVVIATLDKVVERLGDTFPIPVEVVPFAAGTVTRKLESSGFEVRLRVADGAPVVTDNGNHLLDARMPGGIDDPAIDDVAITLMPGVVACGLFVDLAVTAILGRPDGTITTIDREPSNP